MTSGRAWQAVAYELRCLGFICLSPRCLLPKLAVLAGLSYLVGPWDLIPNHVPIFGHVDEIGFALAGLVAARLLANHDFCESAAGGKWQDWAGSARARQGKARGGLRAFLAGVRSDAIAGWLLGTRRLQRLRGHIPYGVERLASQVRSASRQQDLGSALFKLVGYRWWWAIRSLGARSRSEMSNIVVIGGSPRSGTTLLRSMLGRHRLIHSGPETTLFLHRISSPVEVAERLDWDAADIEAWQRQSRSQMEFIERCATAVLDRAGKSIWAEKTPRNVGRFGFVRRRFPHAKLVHIIRDGRDVVCSLRREPFSKVENAAWDSVRAARRCAVQWRSSVKAGLRFRGDPAYHEIRYEDLVRDPEPVLRALLRFLDVPWDQAMLSARASITETEPGAVKAAGHLFASSIGRWRQDLPEADRAALRALIAPLLDDLGYASGQG